MGATYFGHDRLWPQSIVGIFEGEEGWGRGKGGAKGEEGVEGVGAQTQKKGGGPKGGGPKWEPEGWGAQNLVFFSLSRCKIRSFLSSLGSSRGILVVFEVPGRSNGRVWSSLVVVKPRWPPGFDTTTREPKHAHLRVPTFKNTTKKTSKREKKE